MKIYLFRHGEKVLAFHQNPELSPAGTAQALSLVEKVQSSELPRPTQLWASPKLRAQQSFLPLAARLDLPLQTLSELDERTHDENREHFRRRIQEVLNTFSAQDGVLFICTHSDWIEEALTLLPSETDLYEKYPHWHPLQYLGLQTRDELYEPLEFKRIPL